MTLSVIERLLLCDAPQAAADPDIMPVRVLLSAPK